MLSILPCFRYTRSVSQYLQCVAVCCSVLQRVAVCCSVLQQCVAACCSVLQSVVVCCSVLRCVAVSHVTHSSLNTRAVCYVLCVVCGVRYLLRCVAVVAVCCSVLRCVAVCCSEPCHTPTPDYTGRVSCAMCGACHVWCVSHVSELVAIMSAAMGTLSVAMSCSVSQCVAVCCSAL